MSSPEMHPDFLKILGQYIAYHGSSEGISKFESWIALLKLDRKKPFGARAFIEGLNSYRAAAEVKPYKRFTEQDLLDLGFLPFQVKRLLRELYGA